MIKHGHKKLADKVCLLNSFQAYKASSVGVCSQAAAAYRLLESSSTQLPAPKPT